MPARINERWKRSLVILGALALGLAPAIVRGADDGGGSDYSIVTAPPAEDTIDTTYDVGGLPTENPAPPAVPKKATPPTVNIDVTQSQPSFAAPKNPCSGNKHIVNNSASSIFTSDGGDSINTGNTGLGDLDSTPSVDCSLDTSPIGIPSHVSSSIANATPGAFGDQGIQVNTNATANPTKKIELDGTLTHTLLDETRTDTLGQGIKFKPTSKFTIYGNVNVGVDESNPLTPTSVQRTIGTTYQITQALSLDGNVTTIYPQQVTTVSLTYKPVPGLNISANIDRRVADENNYGVKIDGGDLGVGVSAQYSIPWYTGPPLASPIR